MKLYADTQESRTPFSLDIEGVEERINFIVARSFTGFKSTPEAKRMRELVLSQDQKGTFKEEKIADQSLKIEEFKQNLELIDTSELDRSGRILDLAIYFRGPEEYDLSNKTSNMTMKDLLNEFWGLRSGQFLIRQLQDSYSLQLKTEDIEAVFKGQERILEELERRVVF